MTSENAKNGWLDGMAEVVAESGGGITVSCPHCGGTHRHSASFRGSKQVLAGCHSGHGRCRVYAIPGEPPQRRPRWMS
ncbi:hypothetical protein GBO18_02360 [Mycobacterium avium subsp. hominissuis]|nr:hypothetical protein [Mycobacterium avium subsp. hominissuis]